jgi:TolA-binding protein
MTGGAVRDDLAQIRQDLNALTLTLHRSRSDTETVLGQIDRRSREQIAEAQRQLAALQARTEALSSELNRLSGRVEELSGRVEGLSRRLSAPTPQVPLSPPRTGTPPAATGPRSSTSGPPPSDLYQTAYTDFSKGNYPLAISGFQEFLRRDPESDLADNAQYWIAEARLSLAHAHANRGEVEKATQGIEQAVQEFRKVVVNYPRGDKVPTAIYKEALALLELKQANLAMARLQYLLDNFPQSEEAPLARERLAAIKESGQ